MQTSVYVSLCIFDTTVSTVCRLKSQIYISTFQRIRIAPVLYLPTNFRNMSHGIRTAPSILDPVQIGEIQTDVTFALII